MATELASEALRTNASITDLVVKSGRLTRREVMALLSPESLTGTRASHVPGRQ
jgi:aspartate ammonia-lyase